MRNSKKKLLESGFYGLFVDMPERHKENILSMQMRPTNVNQCKIYFDGLSVRSNAKFYPGDIVEICPTREIRKTSLYSRDVRDLVFEVEKDTKYVIPMGYCQYYDIIDKLHPEANCDYEWDPVRKVIVIRAIMKIGKDDILVLKIDK